MASRQEQFLKDHELQETVDEKGRVRRRFVYRGDLYARRISEEQRRAERYLGVLAALGAGALAVFATTRRTPANTAGFFSILSILVLVPVLGVLAGAGLSFFKKGDLTVRDYRERMILLRAMSLVAAVLLVLLTLGYALHGAWLACVAALLAAAVYALVGVHELKVKYTVKARQA